MTIKVVVVDDSDLMCRLLGEIIDGQPDMRAVGFAHDPYQAREMIKVLNPDVLTLDVEMPGMNGLDFLAKLMRLRPMPVVMVSALTEAGSEATLQALELGAVDYIAKGGADLSAGLPQYAERIAEKIRAAAGARILRQIPPASGPPASIAASGAGWAGREQIILVGASTGGTEAIKDFLEPLPEDCPAVLVVQHMPEAFTPAFAARLNRRCPRLTVGEAVDRQPVRAGHVYVAPGHSHLLLAKRGAHYFLRLSDEAPVNRHRPSVDVLFRSATETAAADAVGVILTGMGKDGAAGMLELKRCGARTFAQDQDSCVVFGMPKAAIEIGAVDEVCALVELPARVMKFVKRGAVAKTGIG